jgi:hypothetical protein
VGEEDSRCHIGCRDISTCLCILYPIPQSILRNNHVGLYRKVFWNNVKINWRGVWGRKERSAFWYEQDAPVFENVLMFLCYLRRTVNFTFVLCCKKFQKNHLMNHNDYRPSVIHRGIL